jgi:biopolymer transport protein ExbB
MAKHWKKITVIIMVMFFVAPAWQSFAADSWTQVSQKVEKDQDQAIKDAAETDQIVETDSASMARELAKLKAEEQNYSRQYEAVRAEFLALRNREESLTKELAAEQDEINAIDGTIRGTANDAISLARDNMITAEFPERVDPLNTIATGSRFAGMEGIKTLADFFFKEMEEQAKIVRRSGEFIGPDGKTAFGDIIRIGRFTAYYRMSNGDIGFLVPNPDGKTLVAVTGEVPWSTKRAIKAYFDKKNVVAPIDPSAGGGFTKMAEQENLWEWMARGGPVMYVIFAVACIAGLIMIERFIMLAAKSRASEQVMNRIKDLAKAGKWKEATNFCEIKKNVPTCQMLKGVLEHTGEAQEVLENALQESILKIMPSLERWLGTLALMAVIAPLLGLLGTVTGMITVFNVITSVGTGDPKLMAGGISEALLTTEFGLILAIPIMLVHHLLERRVDSIVYDMQEKGTAFIVTMIKRQS